MSEQGRLRMLYDKLGKLDIKGLPGDYESFRSLLGEPGQAEGFYAQLPKGEGAEGFPASADEFMKMAADASVREAVPLRREVAAGEEEGLPGAAGQEFPGYRAFFPRAGGGTGVYQPGAAAGAGGERVQPVRELLPDLQGLHERRGQLEKEDGWLLREWRRREELDRLMAVEGAVQAHPDSFYADHRERYARAKSETDRLNREIALHPETLAERQAQTEGIAEKRRGVAQARKKLGHVYKGGYIVRGGRNPSVIDLETGGEQEVRYLDDADKLYGDAQALLLAPNKYDDSSGWGNWGKGAARTLTDVDFWTWGFSEVARNFAVRGVYEKMRQNEEGKELDSYLSEGEQRLFDAFLDFTTAQAGRGGDLSVAYQVGEGTPEVVASAVVSALTGGAAGTVSAAARKAMVKWVARNMAKRLSAKGGKLAVKAGMNALSKSAEVILKSAFSSGVYRDASRNAVTLRRDANGDVIVDSRGIPEMEDMATAWWDAGRGAAIHHWADGSFGRARRVVERALPAGVRRDFRESFERAAVSGPEQAFRNIMADPAAGLAKGILLDGVVTDVYEEWYESSLKEITGSSKALQDEDAVEKLVLFTGTLLPKWAVTGGFSVRELRMARRRYDLSREKLTERLQGLGAGEKECSDFVRRMDMASAAEVAAEVTPLVKRVAVQDAVQAGKLVAAFCDYNRSRLEFNLQDGALREFERAGRRGRLAGGDAGVVLDAPVEAEIRPQVSGRGDARKAGFLPGGGMQEADGGGQDAVRVPVAGTVGAFHRSGLGDVALPEGSGKDGQAWPEGMPAGADGGMVRLAAEVIRDGKLVRNGKRRVTITKDGYQAEVRKDVRRGWVLSAFRQAGGRGAAGGDGKGNGGGSTAVESGGGESGGVPFRREHSVEGLTEGDFSWTKLLLQPGAGKRAVR